MWIEEMKLSVCVPFEHFDALFSILKKIDEYTKRKFFY